MAAPLSWRSPRRRLRASDVCVAISGLSLAMLASLASLGCDRPSPAPTAPLFVPSAEAPPATGEHLAPPSSTPTRPPASVSPPAPAPVLSPAQAAPSSPQLCVTDGDVVPSGERASVREPATRGYLAGSTGEAATLAFTYRGRSHSVVALASGDTRTQLGVKLRAQDSCNVIYVMWRVEPKSEIVVQVKRNAARTHDECGNAGYTRVRPTFRERLPALGVPAWTPAGSRDTADHHDHELRAAIVGDELEVFADTKLIWRGALPAAARDLRGPAGFRTDNVDIDFALDAPRDDRDEKPRCKHEPQVSRRSPSL
ncbi:MAG: hypothetical protein ACKV2T_12380 [Kofleriaceae bacterium]